MINEEEEEIAVNISKYAFKCTNCNNMFRDAYMTGCRRCGGNIFLVKYL